MCLILHLETSTKSCSVALSENGKLTDLEELHSAEFTHAENLTVFIEKIMKRVGKKFSELDAISVSSGPGSYTGLRIGVSTAKGLCYALDIPLISVGALVSLASLARIKHQGSICAMIDARRMEVYSAIYDSDLKILKTISADILDENSYSEFEPFLAVGDGAEKMSEAWAGRQVIINTEIMASATGQVEWAYQKYLNQEFEDVAYFEPYYLKEFIAGKPKGK
jgi:tRNA threonylcarbamoyladenosine biosynthesis protein TsaB